MKRKNEYGDGWFHGYSPTDDIDPDGNPIKRDTRAIIGRFIDIDVIDIEASEQAGRSTYKPGTVLETRRASAAGIVDVSAVPIRFNRLYRIAAREAIERFPEAWGDYQLRRKTPVTDSERCELEAMGLTVTEPAEAQAPEAQAHASVTQLKRPPINGAR